MLVIASMCYAFYTIAFLTIVLVITLHASIATLSPLMLFSGWITLDTAYHGSFENIDISDDFRLWWFSIFFFVIAMNKCIQIKCVQIQYSNSTYSRYICPYSYSTYTLIIQ